MTRKNITLTDVAHAAQVSPMTASRAINNRPGVSLETREHVLTVAADLGYVTNRAAQKTLRRAQPCHWRHCNGPGKSIHRLTDRQHERGGLAGRLRDADLFARGTRKAPFRQRRATAAAISDGVIAILPLEFGYLGDLASINIPVITIDHVGERAEFLAITTDCYEGARTAMRHLIGLGHRRIAYITGDERLASARDRHHAYIETISQYGLESDPSLVLPGDFTEIRGFEATVELLSLANPPTAIFAANDLSAFGAITASVKPDCAFPRTYQSSASMTFSLRRSSLRR